jgi:hypothetical protein
MLALWTMAISTGVIDKAQSSAVIAAFNAAAEMSRTAV